LALVGLGAFWVSRDDLADVRIELKSPTQSVLAGSKWHVDSTFVNEGWRTAWLANPIDGADWGWRMVEYKWHVAHASGQPVADTRGGRCGNTNLWKPSDIFPLSAGSSRPIVGGFFDQPRQIAFLGPGRYDISLEYNFDYKAFHHQPFWETMWLLTVTDGTIRSEAVTVDIQPSLDLQIRQKKPLGVGLLNLDDYLALAVENLSNEPLDFAVPDAKWKSSLSVTLGDQYLHIGPPERGPSVVTLAPGEILELPPVFGDEEVHVRTAGSNLTVTYLANEQVIATAQGRASITRIAAR